MSALRTFAPLVIISGVMHHAPLLGIVGILISIYLLGLLSALIHALCRRHGGKLCNKLVEPISARR